MAINTNTAIQRQAPFLEEHVGSLLDSTAALIDFPYEDYTGPRVAGFGGDQLNAFNLARAGIGGYTPYLTGATGIVEDAYGGWQNASNLAQYYLNQGAQGTNINPYLSAASGQINQATSDYANMMQPTMGYVQGSAGATDIRPYVDPAMANAYGISQAVSQTNPEAAAWMRESGRLGQIHPYMNQYRQNVIQDNLREMNRQHEIDQDRIDADAAKSGAFGGSRHGLVESELARNYQQNRSDMINQFNMEGFQNAQQMREAHRGRQFQTGSGVAGLGTNLANAYGNAANTFNQLGQLGLTQQEQGYNRLANAGSTLGQLANQYGTFGLNAATGTQALGGLSAQTQDASYNRMLQSGQNLGQIGQIGSNIGMDTSRVLSGLGGLQQQYNQGDITMLSQIGAMQQGLQQQELDTAYNQWLENQMEPYQRLGFYSDVLHGVPTSQSTVTMSSTPQRSLLAQGLGALGQYASAGQQFGWWGNNNKNSGQS